MPDKFYDMTIPEDVCLAFYDAVNSRSYEDAMKLCVEGGPGLDSNQWNYLFENYYKLPDFAVKTELLGSSPDHRAYIVYQTKYNFENMEYEDTERIIRIFLKKESDIWLIENAVMQGNYFPFKLIYSDEIHFKEKKANMFDRHPGIYFELACPCNVRIYSDNFFVESIGNIIDLFDNSPTAIFKLKNAETNQDIKVMCSYVSQIVVYGDGENYIEFSVYRVKNAEN